MNLQGTFSLFVRRSCWMLGVLTNIVGCAKILGVVMSSAPNKWNPMTAKGNLSPPAQDMLDIDRQLRIDVANPAATLLASIIEPKDYGQPKGTILVVHGICGRSLWMLKTARILADEGFRAVLVDLRGHGRSTGHELTYGVQDARDLSAVIDGLQQENLITGRLGVYGISYGAAAVIQLAGRDPRVDAVVAVAPFSTMRDVVTDYGRTVLPGIESLISDETFQAAVDEAGRSSDFEPDLANAITAMQQTKAPVLIIHGTDDWLVPHYHALRLHEASGGRSELVLLPRTGHIKIWFDPKGSVATHTRSWFKRQLTRGEARLPSSEDGSVERHRHLR